MKRLGALLAAVFVSICAVAVGQGAGKGFGPLASTGVLSWFLSVAVFL